MPGERADNRANQVLREHGYPTEHRARADQRRPSGRRHGGGDGPQPQTDPARSGRPAGPAPDDAVVRPASGAHALDVEDPYYGTDDDFEDVFAVIQASLPGLHDWVDEQLAGAGSRQLMRRWAFLLRPRLARAVRRGDRVRLPVLHRPRAVAARQEHQDEPGELPDLPVADRRARCADECSATAGFVGARRTVAAGDGDRALSARPPGAGATPGDRGRCRVRGACAVRRRRRSDGPRGPRLPETRAGFEACPDSRTLRMAP